MKKSKKNVSKYVQDSLLEFDSLATTLKENANDTVKDLLDESVRKTYRELLAEESGKDDEDVEDEVEDTDDKDVDVSGFGAKSKDAGKADDDDDDDDFEADFEDEDGRGHVSFKSGKDGKGGKWAQFSKYKVSDGEYDFTNAEDDEIVNAYNMLGDDDKVVVTKDDDSHINVKDNETGTEYIIDLDTMDAEKAVEDDEFSDDSLDSYVDDELSDVEDDLMDDLDGDDDDDTEIEVEMDDPKGDSDDDEEAEVEYLVPDDDDDDDEDDDDDDDSDINEGKISDFMKNGLDKAKHLVKRFDDWFFDGLDKPNPLYEPNNFFVDDDEEDEDDDENKKKHKKMKNESKIFEIYLNEDDNLGYTDNYQKDDVMTTPGMDEPGKNVNDWDKGVPRGKAKPWSGYKGQKSADQPFNEGILREFGDDDYYGEDDDYDIPSEEELRELLGGQEYTGSPEDEKEMESFRHPEGFDDDEILGDEEPTEECGGYNFEENDDLGGVEEGGHTFGKVQAHSTAKTYLRNNPSEDAYEDTIGSASKSGKHYGRKRKGEGVDESIRRIYRENKQLKKALLRFKGTLQEAALTNVNLGQIIKLLSENATTFDEKKEIISRFGNEVNSIKDSKRLYESISRELKRKGGLALNEGRQYGVLGSRKLNETQIYQDKDMLKSLDLMHKLCK